MELHEYFYIQNEIVSSHIFLITLHSIRTSLLLKLRNRPLIFINGSSPK